MLLVEGLGLQVLDIKSQATGYIEIFMIKSIWTKFVASQNEQKHPNSVKNMTLCAPYRVQI
jgi:hypothetical protein